MVESHDLRLNKEVKIVEWETVKSLVQELATQLSSKGIKQIFGLPRGGTLLAVLFSHALRKPIIFDDSLIDSSTLIVDDVISSGHTLCELLHENKATGALLFLSEQAVPELKQYELLFVGKLKSPEHWLLFPWEKDAK